MKKSLLSLLLCLSLCCSGCSATQVKDRLYLQSLELSLPDCSTARFSVRRSRLFRQWQHAFRCTGIRRNSSWKVPFLGTFGTARAARTKILAAASRFVTAISPFFRLQAALYHSLAGRSQHGNAAGKPETRRTKRTHSRNRLALDSKGTLQFLRNGSVALSDYQRLFHGADRLERNNTNALQRCHSRAVLAAGQQLSRTGQLIDRRSSKRLSHYQCFDQIHRHHRKWHSHCNCFDFHSWNGKCCRSARTVRSCL